MHLCSDWNPHNQAEYKRECTGFEQFSQVSRTSCTQADSDHK